MRTRTLILLAVVAAASWCRADGAPIYDCKVSSALLPAGPSDASPRAYDVQRYELDLRLDPGLRRLDGSVAVALQILDGHGGGAVVLDLVDALTVTGVVRDGLPVSFTHAGDTLVVAAPEVVHAGATTTIVVSYGGRPLRHGELNMGLVFRDRSPSPDVPLGPVIFNVSEPASSHAWWPCHDVPSDKATVRLALTVPDTLQAVANGLLVADSPADPGWRTTVWESSAPMPPYLVGLAVSEFVAWEEPCPGAFDEVLLTYHAFPEDEDVARTFFAPTCEAMGFLEDIAGPYPFAHERYGQMEVKWGGAMEHQTSSSMGNALIHTPALFLNAVVHELAHQWFGDLITPASWRDIWLNEGFARYCEALWAERRGGRSAYLAFLHRIGPERHPALFSDEGLLTDPSPILRSLVYDKGAWILHMLREHLGDDVFFDLLRAYAGDPALRYGTVDTAAFVAHASAAAGRDMGPWFTPWLATAEVPTLAWSWRAFPAALSGDGVIIDIAQQQSTLFELAVPVHVVAGGDTLRHVLNCDGPATRRRIATGAPVSDVLLDPDGTLLLATTPLPAPVIAITAVRPNPVGAEGAAVDISLLHAGAVTVTVYDVRGRVMGSWELGRLAAGTDHTWTWPGRGERRWAAGVYWLEAASGGARSVRKVVTVR